MNAIIFFFQAEDGIRDGRVTGVQTCALPICIAVLGDMLELGPEGDALHAALSEIVVANAIDLVFCAGPLMKSLWHALPSERRGGYAETSALLEGEVLGAIAGGDAVMVKGSLGARIGPIVKALKRRYTRQTEQDQGSTMLYWLADFSSTISL